MASVGKKGNIRRKKTKAEIKSSAAKQLNRKIREDKASVKNLAKDRNETQSAIGEAISSVLAISKTLGDERVSSIIPEEKFKECADHIQEFKDLVNKVTPKIKQCFKNMEDLEDKMLKDINKKDEHWVDYSMAGIAMIEAADELTHSSINTTLFCGSVINESLSNIEEEKEGE